HSATRRLSNRIFLSEFQPKFRLDEHEPVFCLGGCYARVFEELLHRHGLDVPSLIADAPSVDIMNRYNIFAILNELRWALNPLHYPFPEASLIINEQEVVDPHLSSAAPGSLNDVRAIRGRVTETVRQVLRCRLVVLFLGQIEAWYDRK